MAKSDFNIYTTGGWRVSTAQSIWTPADISVLWLRADLGITKDGSNILSSWKDQGPSGVNYTAFGTPTWIAAQVGGKPIVRFNGSTDAFQNIGTAIMNANESRSMIFILKYTLLDPPQWSFLLGPTQRFNAGDWGIVMMCAGLMPCNAVGGPADMTIFQQYGGGPTAGASSHDISNYTAAFVSLREDVNFSTMKQAVYRNGVLVPLDSEDFAVTEVNCPGQEGSFFGCEFVGGGPRRYWSGDIAEIIMTNGIISDANWTALQSYFTSRYGL